jgi:hypothetical protein
VQWSSSLPTHLPRALQALAHEAVVTEDGPRPPDELEPSRHVRTVVVLAGRAPGISSWSYLKSSGAMNVEMSEVSAYGVASRRARSSSTTPVAWAAHRTGRPENRSPTEEFEYPVVRLLAREHLYVPASARQCLMPA